MKRILILLIPFLLISEKTFSQENVVKLYPLSLIYKNIKLGYELKITDRKTIQLLGGFLIPGPIPKFITNDVDLDYDIKMGGYNMDLDYKI